LLVCPKMAPHRTWIHRFCENLDMQCLYCSALGDSREHPLPAALGEFRDAPYLDDRVCRACNNTRLGVLDEQFTRCGPEALLRKFYDIRGRTETHDKVNVFERRSAGGHRVDMRSTDKALGVELGLEIVDGQPRQLRQMVFVEQSGKTHVLPILEGSTPDQLRAAFQLLGVVQPCADVRVFFDPAKENWVPQLIQQAWPDSTLGEGTLASTMYEGAVGTLVLTNRYFRAVAKIGFHYFLTQFPEYTGHEQMFADIRQFISDETAGVDRANVFIGKREHALLGEMLNPRVRPNGWRSHALCAETRPAECLAYVQTFVTEDWPAPIYAVRLAQAAGIVDCRATGHAYMYYVHGPEGNFAGDALTLYTTRTNLPPPPLKPVVMSPSAD
jgi:hypothetical protein